MLSTIRFGAIDMTQLPTDKTHVAKDKQGNSYSFSDWELASLEPDMIRLKNKDGETVTEVPFRFEVSTPNGKIISHVIADTLDLVGAQG